MSWVQVTRGTEIFYVYLDEQINDSLTEIQSMQVVFLINKLQFNVYEHIIKCVSYIILSTEK